MAFNGRFLLNLIYNSNLNEGAIKEAISKTGKTPEELCEESCTIENEIYNRSIEQISKLSKDLHFGLHAGERLNLSAAGLISQITQTCSTVKEALEYCCHFASLGCSCLPMFLSKDKDHYKLELKPDLDWRANSEEAFRQTVEGVLAFTIKEFHSLTRMTHYPIKINLDWENKKVKKEEYLRVFCCTTNFNTGETAIFFNKSHVEQNIITSDFNLLRILVQHAEEKVNKMSKSDAFTGLVKQTVIKLVKPDFPRIDQVAQHLNLSLRTLQRRLKEEGVKYKSIVDDLKKEFSFQYLKNPDLSISDIAYLLDYRDTSSFSRAFKRWTGVRPKMYIENEKKP